MFAAPLSSKEHFTMFQKTRLSSAFKKEFPVNMHKRCPYTIHFFKCYFIVVRILYMRSSLLTNC